MGWVGIILVGPPGGTDNAAIASVDGLAAHGTEPGNRAAAGLGDQISMAMPPLLPEPVFRKAVRAEMSIPEVQLDTSERGGPAPANRICKLIDLLRCEERDRVTEAVETGPPGPYRSGVLGKDFHFDCGHVPATSGEGDWGRECRNQYLRTRLTGMGSAAFGALYSGAIRRMKPSVDSVPRVRTATSRATISCAVNGPKS